jgi:hypothetical protein
MEDVAFSLEGNQTPNRAASLASLSPLCGRPEKGRGREEGLRVTF